MPFGLHLDVGYLCVSYVFIFKPHIVVSEQRFFTPSGFRLWHRRGTVVFFLVLCLFFYLAYSTEGTHQNVRFLAAFFFSFTTL